VLWSNGGKGAGSCARRQPSRYGLRNVYAHSPQRVRKDGEERSGSLSSRSSPCPCRLVLLLRTGGRVSLARYFTQSIDRLRHVASDARLQMNLDEYTDCHASRAPHPHFV